MGQGLEDEGRWVDQCFEGECFTRGCEGQGGKGRGDLREGVVVAEGGVMSWAGWERGGGWGVVDIGIVTVLYTYFMKKVQELRLMISI